MTTWIALPRMRGIARRQPVSIAILSRWTLERQITAHGATWLDRQLVGRDGTAVAGTGFGRNVADALHRRQAHLVTQGLAHQEGDRTIYQRALLGTLMRRELARAGARLADETGLETGWKMTGCLRLACNEARLAEFREQAELARGFGMSETIAITDDGYERLTNFPRRLFVA